MSDLNFPVYPAWAANGRSNWDQEDSAAQQAFQSSFNRSADQKNEMNMLRFRQQMANDKQKQQAALMSEMLTPVANAFSGVKSPAQAWEVASQHPEWMANPIQGEFVDRILKTQNEVAKAQIGSLQGQMNVADTTDFMKRLSAIDAADRAAIRAMQANKDGSVSADQWKALDTAEGKIKTRQLDARRYAETEALLRGDVPTTTIDEKGGVTTVFKPASGEDSGGEPIIKEIDGTKIIYRKGGSRFQVINPKGKELEFTADQFRNLAGDLPHKDPRKLKILEVLADAAIEQLTPNSPARTNTPPAAAAPPVQKDPLGLFK